ncbi:MAG: UbiX family flavin prenyltransferase [Planctomycetaceae bacterium]|jgi:4-hydroxy-3-polyprenylbenzoate decarboxylase|nr:UbiX family flavin prenyltransferase [Planctomycetaceae bacterium]
MKIILAMTAASGTVYGFRLLERLEKSGHEIHLIASPTWQQVAQQEGFRLPEATEQITLYDPLNMNVPPASGSSRFDAMIVAPCSAGSLSCIASGINQHLVHRAAEVQLKERRRLVLLFRESPLSLIHIQNMERVTLAGGIVQTASPHFYTNPQTLDDLIDTVVSRTLQLINAN